MQPVCEVTDEPFGRLYCNACQTSKPNALFPMKPFRYHPCLVPVIFFTHHSQHILATFPSVFHATTLILSFCIIFWNFLGTNAVWLGVKAYKHNMESGCLYIYMLEVHKRPQFQERHQKSSMRLPTSPTIVCGFPMFSSLGS
jgi:hypothetical protein